MEERYAAKVAQKEMEIEFNGFKHDIQMEMKEKEIEMKEKEIDMMKKWEHRVEKSQDQLARAHAMKKLKNAGDFQKIVDKTFLEHLILLSQLPVVPKTARVSVVVAGPTCAGKTTLLKTWHPQLNLEAKPFANTRGAKCVHHTSRMEFYDVFGVNDVEKYQTLQTLNLIKSLNFVIVVYSDSILAVIDLIKMVKALGNDINLKVFRNNKTPMTDEEFDEVEEEETGKLIEVLVEMNVDRTEAEHQVQHMWFQGNAAEEVGVRALKEAIMAHPDCRNRSRVPSYVSSMSADLSADGFRAD